MSTPSLPIRRIDRDVPLPAKDARAIGLDLPCRVDMAIPPGRIGVVPVNCVVAVPDNHFLMLAIRSSTPIKRGLILANGIGVVDPFFCGNSDEIVVQLLNVGETVAHIQRGESLVQAILMRSEDFNWTEVASMNQVRDENIGYDLEEVHGTVVTLNQRGNTDKESL